MAAERGSSNEVGAQLGLLVEMEAAVHQRLKPLTAAEQGQIAQGQIWARRALWDSDGCMTLSRNTTSWGKDYWELNCEDDDERFGIRQHPFSVIMLQVCWSRATGWEDATPREYVGLKEAFDVALATLPETPKIENDILPLPASA